MTRNPASSQLSVATGSWQPRSKHNTKRSLQNPWITRARDGAKAVLVFNRIKQVRDIAQSISTRNALEGDVAVDPGELGMIEGVEGIQAELQGNAFPHRECLLE